MLRSFCLLALLALPFLALADPPADKTKAPEADKEALSVTEGSVTIGGKKIDYKATAGRLPLTEDGGKAKAPARKPARKPRAKPKSA